MRGDDADQKRARGNGVWVDGNFAVEYSSWVDQERERIFWPVGGRSDDLFIGGDLPHHFAGATETALFVALLSDRR
ncbi:hypothetical protein D3C84_1060250 [compost metagenome]